MDAVKLKIKKSAYLRRLSEISSTLRAYEQAKDEHLIGTTDSPNN